VTRQSHSYFAEVSLTELKVSGIVVCFCAGVGVHGRRDRASSVSKKAANNEVLHNPNAPLSQAEIRL
jgi:hypothetical protein